MKSKELIALIQALDPSGEMETIGSVDQEFGYAYPPEPKIGWVEEREDRGAFVSYEGAPGDVRKVLLVGD